MTTRLPGAEAPLVEACVRGDQQAWAQLYARYYPYVHRITSWSRWRFTASESEDCAQDVFVELTRVLPLFRGESALTTFLSRLARNRCVSLIRRKTALKRGSELVGFALEQGRDVEEPLALAISPDPGPLEEMLARDEVSEIVRWFRTLNQDCQVILTLRYFEDLAYDQICGRLELPLGTVCSRIKRCLDRLRKLAQPT